MSRKRAFNLNMTQAVLHERLYHENVINYKKSGKFIQVMYFIKKFCFNWRFLKKKLSKSFFLGILRKFIMRAR